MVAASDGKLSVGVVIPAFNAAEVVAGAAESVLGQEPVPDRVIVVDDGSTDDTPSVVGRYAGRLEVLRQPNRGPAAARNAGWARLETDAVVFLDADDLLLPGALARRRALLEDTDAAWAHTEGMLQDESGARRGFSQTYPPAGGKVGGWIFSDLLCRNFITTGAAIVRRQALQAVGGFDEDLRRMEDWDLWLRLAVRHPVLYDSRPTFVQRLGPHTLSTDREAMIRMRYQILAKTHRLFPAEVVAAGPAARRSVADAHNAIGYALAREGRWAEARTFLRTSVRLCPRQRRAWWLLLRSLGRPRSAARPAGHPTQGSNNPPAAPPPGAGGG